MADISNLFETRVQFLKYSVLKNVAEAAFRGDLTESVFDIPKKIIPGNKPTMRCCVYKERAILLERVRLAMGGDRSNPNVIEVISIACDECPETGYQVSDYCRGCIAHHCGQVCPTGALTYDAKQHAFIDGSKCIQCGKCAQACPYGAILNRIRPCETACKTGAISAGEDGAARIREDRCVACGACVYRCPFGAIMEKSYILDTVELLKQAEADPDGKLVAVLAPSFAAQSKTVSMGHAVAALKKLGFTDVMEAAFGGDLTAAAEAGELAAKGTLTSSCCPAFVALIRKQFPEMASLISDTPSPMAMVGMAVKAKYPEAKVVFIGPCTAKKAEAQLPEVKAFVDNVITFEELAALWGAKGISPDSLEPEKIDDASRYGRNFAQSGGVTAAVTKALREQSGDVEDAFEVRPVICDGIGECLMTLKKAKAGRIDGNFIEGMACAGGCVNGPVSLRRLGASGKIYLERYAGEAAPRTITEAAEKGVGKL